MKPDYNRSPERDDRLIHDTRNLPAQIRLIDTREGIPDDQKTKIISSYEANRIRLDSGLDLILIQPAQNEALMVLKLADYGKLRYDEQKQKREQDKKNHENARGIKEFYFTPKLADHDYETKLRLIREALDKNYDIRIGVKLNHKTKMGLSRGVSLAQAARQDDFVLKRVLKDLGATVLAGPMNFGDRNVSVSMKKNKFVTA